MNVAQLLDLDHFVNPVKASARAATRNAGDTGAAAAVNGLAIDLHDITVFPQGRPRCVQVVQPFRITQDTGKSVTVSTKGQHRSATSGAGSTWADIGATLGASTGSKVVSNTTTSTDQATDAQAVAKIRLDGAKRYFRTVTTPAFSATATGPTLDLDAAVANFGGFSRTPARG